MIMIERIKRVLSKITPRIYNLPQVIFIKWMDMEFFIKKS